MRRDRDAEFEAFVQGSGRELLRLAIALAGDRGAGEDLLQDVLEKVYIRWHRIERPSAYVHRALVNTSTNRWRRRYRHPETVLMQDHERPSADEIAGADDRDAIVRALRRLPARQRAVVVLRFLADLSEADAAGALGCSVGTIKSQTARALASLRAEMPAATDAPRTRC